MKDIPLERTLEILDSYSKTMSFTMNHGKQIADTSYDWEDVQGKELFTYPGTEVPYILEKYWDSVGKDYDKELPKLFKTSVNEDGSIQMTYKWYPLVDDLEEEDYNNSLFPEYFDSWDEFQKVRDGEGDQSMWKKQEDLREYFAQTDAHDLLFYTRRAGRRMNEEIMDNFGVDPFTQVWTVFKGQKYITSILIHED